LSSNQASLNILYCAICKLYPASAKCFLVAAWFKVSMHIIIDRAMKVRLEWVELKLINGHDF